jgi:hypothetical protein
MPGAFPEEVDDAVFPPRETVGWRLFDAKPGGRAGFIVAVGSAKAII